MIDSILNAQHFLMIPIPAIIYGEVGQGIYHLQGPQHVFLRIDLCDWLHLPVVLILPKWPKMAIRPSGRSPRSENHAPPISQHEHDGKEWTKCASNGKIGRWEILGDDGSTSKTASWPMAPDRFHRLQGNLGGTSSKGLCQWHDDRRCTCIGGKKHRISGYDWPTYRKNMHIIYLNALNISILFIFISYILPVGHW